MARLYFYIGIPNGAIEQMASLSWVQSVQQNAVGTLTKITIEHNGHSLDLLADIQKENISIPSRLSVATNQNWDLYLVFPEQNIDVTIGTKLYRLLARYSNTFPKRMLGPVTAKQLRNRFSNLANEILNDKDGGTDRCGHVILGDDPEAMAKAVYEPTNNDVLNDNEVDESTIFT